MCFMLIVVHVFLFYAIPHNIRFVWCPWSIFVGMPSSTSHGSTHVWDTIFVNKIPWYVYNQRHNCDCSLQVYKINTLQLMTNLLMPSNASPSPSYGQSSHSWHKRQDNLIHDFVSILLALFSRYWRFRGGCENFRWTLKFWTLLPRLYGTWGYITNN
jgi:hypothetical protein